MERKKERKKERNNNFSTQFSTYITQNINGVLISNKFAAEAC